jgi:PhoPQ-activated pathogenicity-related protein
MHGRSQLPRGTATGPGALEMTRRDFGRAALTTGLLTATGDLAAAPAAMQSPVGAAETRGGVLAEYVHRDDPATRFEAVTHGKLPAGEWLTGRLVSQSWQGVEWTHELSLVVPEGFAGTAGPMLLWIDGGSSGKLPADSFQGPSDSVRMLATLSAAAGLPAAVVRQVPFQPMFDGLVEDGLIAHSFGEYVRTGDPTWPLLVPMVKAAVEAVTAAERAFHDRWGLDVDGFVPAGASKRGWTTWLTSAVDDRVRGLVPMVIDMLALERHLALQRASFGRLSAQLEDYTSRGIEKLIESPRGRDLVRIVDPYAYRDRLVQPKVIVLGTNDAYWPLEACGLYYDDLEGPNWISYAPNAGHGVPFDRVGGLVAAMGRHAAGIESLPEVRWAFHPEAGGCACQVECPDAEPERVLVWTAVAPTRDFRAARWEASAAERSGDGWQVAVNQPAAGFAACLVELHFPRRPLPLVLTSGVRVVGA